MDTRARLELYRSDRTEVLVDELARVLETPPGGPFTPECLVVQSRGMATWLNQQLAQRHGVWAQCEFPFPRNFVLQAFRAVLGESVAEHGFSRSRLLWAVLAALPDCLTRPAFASLSSYLGADEQGLRAFQLSRRVAAVFDQYLTYRPEMILAWETGELPEGEQRWQGELWNEVTRRLGGGHMAAVEEAFHRELPNAVERGAALPRRVSVFGVASLPPMYLRVLVALTRVCEVRLFVSVPSPAAELSESWGEIGREFEALIDQVCEKADVAVETWERFEVAPGSSDAPAESVPAPGGHPLLPFGRSPKAPEVPAAAPLPPIDLHSCHSPMREVEVLHDQLLSLLAGTSGVEPRDVVVMMPDVEVYAPLIEAVFDRDPEDPCYVPYRIADRPIRSDSPVVEAFQRILALVGGRAGASEVLDLLRLEPIHDRFGLEASDLEQVIQWVTESGVRWGIDASDRAANEQPAAIENTWAFGLQRLMLGYAMPTNGRSTFAGVLPYDEIEGQSALLLGRLAEFCERLFSRLVKLREPRTLPAWREDLGELLDALFARDPDAAWEHQRIRTALGEMADTAAEMGFEDQVELAVLRALLEPQIDEAHPERGFLSGGVTFCAFVPMRSIPFRVVAMIGMGDGAFPRTDRPVDFDLLAHGPRCLGDRQRRSDDRYLFLEALMAARDRVIVTFPGQSIRDNSEQPPAVVVQELLDAIAPAGLTRVEHREWVKRTVVRHPLQAFSRQYFDGSSEVLFSYADAYRQGAESLGDVGVEVASLFTGELPEPEEASAKTLAVEELVRFVQHPVAYLLNRRLTIYLREPELQVPDREPLELDPLSKYQVGQRLLELRLDGISPEDSLALERGHGILPAGAPGTVAHAGVLRTAEKIAVQLQTARQGGRLPTVLVHRSLPDGTRLVGSLTGVFEPAVVAGQFSRVRAKHLLATWVRHLVQCWVTGDDARESLLVGRAKAYRGKQRGNVEVTRAHIWKTVPSPERHLMGLIGLMADGLRAPLRFAPDSSYAYAQSLHADGDERRALFAARREWTAYRTGEGLIDPHLRRVFGEAEPPFDDAVTSGLPFGELARVVFFPMLDYLATKDH